MANGAIRVKNESHCIRLFEMTRGVQSTKKKQQCILQMDESLNSLRHLYVGSPLSAELKALNESASGSNGDGNYFARILRREIRGLVVEISHAGGASRTR